VNKHKQFYLAGCLFVFVFVLSACTSIHQPTSGFLGDYSNLQKGKYFKQEYVVGSADLTKFKKVKVNPVETGRFQNANNEYSDAEIQNMAGELKTSLEKRLSKRYEILGPDNRPDQETLVIAPALIYMTSPERALNAATIWFFGLQFSKGSAALEAKLIDGGSGQEIARVAEQRKGGGGLFDLKSLVIGGFFRFTHAEGAFTRWGKNFDKMTSPQKK
jgi:hypothetical protein